MSRALVDLGAEREAGEDRELLCSVMSFDVEGWIGFGINEPPRVLEAGAEAEPLLFHPRQDVIAGAVEDAIDALERIAGKPFTQRLEDRDRAADRRLEIERDVTRLRLRGERNAIARKQRLVGGDDRFAGCERGFNRSLGRIATATDQFDEHVDIGIARERHRVGMPFQVAEIDAAFFVATARADRDDLEAAAEPRGKRLALLGDLRNQRRADRADPGNADFERRRQWQQYDLLP